MNIIPADYELELSAFGNAGIAEIRKDICRKIAAAARTCYKSEGNASDEAADEKLIRSLVRNGHEAMLEHAALTVRFTTDRGVANELVRHRLASFAQESTRYCNYSGKKFASEITYIDISNAVKSLDPVTRQLSRDQQSALLTEWTEACQDAERHYMNMIALGASPQIARSVLNLSTKTELVMTANLREWRHILLLRGVGVTGAPHPQMLELMDRLLITMDGLLPAVFDDLLERRFLVWKGDGV